MSEMKMKLQNANIIRSTATQLVKGAKVKPADIRISKKYLHNKMTVSQNSKQSKSIAKKSLDFYSMDGEETIFTCKQLSFSLSDLVLLIHQVFRSVNFCSITKEELVQKIIMNNFEIDDHSEVEMQIRNLEKLVPDWICKKLEPSGDLLYKVTKVSDINSVCERVNVI